MPRYANVNHYRIHELKRTECRKNSTTAAVLVRFHAAQGRLPTPHTLLLLRLLGSGRRLRCTALLAVLLHLRRSRLLRPGELLLLLCLRRRWGPKCVLLCNAQALDVHGMSCVPTRPHIPIRRHRWEQSRYLCAWLQLPGLCRWGADAPP